MPKGLGKVARKNATARPRGRVAGGGSDGGAPAANARSTASAGGVPAGGPAPAAGPVSAPQAAAEAVKPQAEEQKWAAAPAVFPAPGGPAREPQASGAALSQATLSQAGSGAAGTADQQPGTSYDLRKELWEREFRSHRGEEITLRDGGSLTVGETGDSRLRHGKKKDIYTVGYYTTSGMDAAESIEQDPEGALVHVHDGSGNVASFDYASGVAGESAGGEKGDITPLQAAAVMAGDRVRAASEAGDPVADQYASAFDAYWNGSRGADSLTEAADAHYAYRNNMDASESLTFGEGGLNTAASARRDASSTPSQAPEPAGATVGAASGLDPARGFTAAHEAVLSYGATTWQPPNEGGMTEADRAHIKEPDPSYRLTDAHAEVLSDICYERHNQGVATYSIGGDPGTGKNFALEQLSAVEGRPHHDITVNEGMEFSEFFGATTMDETGTHFTEGKLIGPLTRGHRVVINEPNTLPSEVLTQLYDVAGSRGDRNNRWVTIASPDREAEDTSIKVHPETDVVFTYNPEGTTAQKLPPALKERSMNHIMEAPTTSDRAAMMQSHTEKSHRHTTGQTLSDEDSMRLSRFFDQARNFSLQQQEGFEELPHSRWATQLALKFTGGRSRGGSEGAKKSVLKHCRQLLDNGFAAEEERQSAHDKLSDAYDRCFGIK